MRKINILYVLGDFSISGGVETFVENFYLNMNNDIINLGILVYDDSNNSKISTISNKKVKVHYVIRPKKGLLNHMLSARKILKVYEYNIIHTHINEMGLFTIISSLFTNTKIRICHSHNTKFYHQKSLFFFRTLLNVFSTAKFACSNEAGIALFGKKRKFQVITNSINTSKFHYNPSKSKEIKEELSLGENFIVGHVGRFSEQKNHIFLIDVFKELLKINSNSILLLVGLGEKFQVIKTYVEKLDIVDKVIFLGERNDVNRIMQSMDVFVLPSTYEGLGIVLIEAQAACVKCIVSENVPEEVNITKKIIYMSLDLEPQQWAKMVNDQRGLSKDPRMGEIVEKSKYNIENNIVFLEELYFSYYNNQKI